MNTRTGGTPTPALEQALAAFAGIRGWESMDNRCGEA